VAFPLLMFSAAMSVDATRMIVARRHAMVVADSVAHAGAIQYQRNSSRIDATRANGEMDRLFRLAKHGVPGDPSSSLPLTPDARLALARATPTSTEVVIEYNLRNLLVLGLFQSGPAEFRYQVRSVAQICQPGASRLTVQSSCVSPR
jgi:hypothetical protein